MKQHLPATAAAAVFASALALLWGLEGNRNKPYKDIGGVVTVCMGHTGPDIQDRTYSNTECKAMAEQDVKRFMASVQQITPNITGNQLVAATSFAYNVGLGAYQRSSVAKHFNKGELREGCQAMKQYIYVRGKPIQGLINRRDKEFKVCVSGL